MNVLATEFIRKCARLILQILLVAIFIIIFGKEQTTYEQFQPTYEQFQLRNYILYNEN